MAGKQTETTFGNNEQTEAAKSKIKQDEASSEAPKASPEAPKTSLEAPKTSPEAPKTSLEAPKTSICTLCGMKFPNTDRNRTEHVIEYHPSMIPRKLTEYLASTSEKGSKSIYEATKEKEKKEKK